MKQRDIDAIKFHILRADKALQAIEFELEIDPAVLDSQAVRDAYNDLLIEQSAIGMYINRGGEQ